MFKKLIAVLFIVSMFVMLTACSKHEKTIEKAVEELEYHVLVPNYVPTDLELKEAILDGSLLIQRYANKDETVFIEISQNKHAKGLNIDRLLEYLDTGEDPYETIPDWSYSKIGDFVGELEVNRDYISYMFIPAIQKSEMGEDWYPSYWITAERLREEEFQKVVQSLD